MSDSPQRVHSTRGSITDDGGESALETTTGAPRWVKASAIVALAVVLMLALMLLFGGGKHGPGRHTSGDAGSPVAPASVAEPRAAGDQGTASGVPGSAGHTPPAGGHGP